MLYAFVQKQKALKSASQMNITYVVGGRYSVDGNIVHRYVITRDKDLEDTKKAFSVVTSLHIYSIQKCRLKDSNSLYTIDYDIQQQHNSEDNRWSHIYCPAAKRLADNGAHRGRDAHKVNGVLHDDKKSSTSKMVNGESGSSHTSKGLSTLGTEQKSKASGAKAKKGQMSALEMFAAKPSASKNEKGNRKKAEDAPDDKDDKSKAAQTKPDSSKAGGMKSFFGQNTTVKKVSEKPGTPGSEKEVNAQQKSETISEKPNQTIESNNKKRELSSGDEEDPLPSKLSKTVKADSKDNKVSKGGQKKVQKKEDDKKAELTKSSKTGKKKAVTSESDEEPEEKPKKRRKRMKELPKEDSSDDEETVVNAEADQKPPPDQGSNSSESPLPQQQPQQTEKDAGRRRKRKRELKSKTYMNDEGFMVTEKVWESDSTDASDNEVQITEPQTTKEKQPSPAKKPSKRIHTDMKNKGTKQASLTSFFKKT